MKAGWIEISRAGLAAMAVRVYRLIKNETMLIRRDHNLRKMAKGKQTAELRWNKNGPFAAQLFQDIFFGKYKGSS